MWQTSVYIACLASLTLLSAAAAAYLWMRRPVPGTTEITVLMAAATVWILTYTFWLVSDSESAMLFWKRIQYVAIVSVPASWLTFTLRYTGRSQWVTPRTILSLAVEPILMVSAVFTNSFHRWVWTGLSVAQSGPFNILVRPHGLAHLAHTGYSYLLLLISLVLLVQMAVRSRYLYRRQAIIMMIALLLSVGGNFLMLSGVELPAYIDLSPWAVSISGLAITLSLFKQGLGDIVQVARSVVFDEMGDGVLVLDRAHRVVDMNPVAQETVGCRLKAGLGQSLAQLSPPLASTLDGEDDSQREIIFSGFDGEPMVYDVRVSSILDWKEAVVGKIVVLRDVTERARIEDRLRRSEARLRAVIQNMPVLMAAVGPDDRLVAWNREDERVTGYLAEEVLGRDRSLEDLIPRWELEEQDSTLEDSRRGRLFNLRARDGTVKTILWSTLSDRFPITGWKIWGIGVDLTAHRQMELALRESESRYRTLIESAPVMIGVVSEGEIRFLNEAGLALLGIQKAENVVGRSITEFIAPQCCEAMEDRLARTMAEKRRSSLMDERWVRMDGVEVDVEGVVIPFTYSGEPAVQIVARDVTARKRAERQAVRAERLAAMGQLAAALAHEINNPLQAIRSNFELVVGFDLPEEERLECLRIADEQIEQLSKLVQHMLDFTKVSSATRYPVAASLLVENTLVLMRKQLQRSDVEVEIDLPEGLPPLFAAPNELVQVFINLLLNAIEVMPEGGQVAIRAQAGSDGNVVLTLSNDGPPIPDDQLSHIFEPFFTTKKDGTGLGLYVTHKIVQQHHGEIYAQNLGDGRGVKFVLRLPTADQVVSMLNQEALNEKG